VQMDSSMVRPVLLSSQLSTPVSAIEICIFASTSVVYLTQRKGSKIVNQGPPSSTSQTHREPRLSRPAAVLAGKAAGSAGRLNPVGLFTRPVAPR